MTSDEGGGSDDMSRVGGYRQKLDTSTFELVIDLVGLFCPEYTTRHLARCIATHIAMHAATRTFEFVIDLIGLFVTLVHARDMTRA